MAATDLCTLAQVREHGQYQPTDTAQDTVAGALITRLSALIMRYCAREFAPAVNAQARTFRLRPGRCIQPVIPRDLRAATAVAVDGQTLPASQWQPAMLDGPNGVYGAIEFAYVPPSRWSARTLQITGDWGFQSVPEDVVEACVLAVGLYLRAHVSGFGTALQPNSLGDGVNAAAALPPGIRGMLDPFRRAAATL